MLPPSPQARAPPSQVPNLEFSCPPLLASALALSLLPASLSASVFGSTAAPCVVPHLVHDGTNPLLNLVASTPLPHGRGLTMTRINGMAGVKWLRRRNLEVSPSPPERCARLVRSLLEGLSPVMITSEVNTTLPTSHCRLPSIILSLRNRWRSSPLVLSGSTTKQWHPSTVLPTAPFYLLQLFVSSQGRCHRRSMWRRQRPLPLHQDYITGRVRRLSTPRVTPKKSKFTTTPSRNNLPLRPTA